jgi:hypothetical protein
MTKKDYIALSKLFKGLKTLRPEDIPLCLMARLGRHLAQDNPTFDSDRFVAACRKEYEMGSDNG